MYLGNGKAHTEAVMTTDSSQWIESLHRLVHLLSVRTQGDVCCCVSSTLFMTTWVIKTSQETVSKEQTEQEDSNSQCKVTCLITVSQMVYSSSVNAYFSVNISTIGERLDICRHLNSHIKCYLYPMGN